MSRLESRAAAFVVGAAGVSLASNLLVLHWPHADSLWYSFLHDRNTHYLQGLTLAMSVRDLDVMSLLRQLQGIQIWGLVHPVLEGIVQLAAGPSHRLAVLPSLFGWVASALLGFQLVRRLSPSYGQYGGFLAAFFILTSPGHRAYATDVMLESLGACLSLAVLYSYVVFIQEDTRRASQLLAATWALLFLHKYNYWLLVTIAILLAEGFRRRAAVLAFVRRYVPLVPGWLRGQTRRASSWIVLIAMIGALSAWQADPLTLAWQFHGLLQIVILIVCVRLVIWWRRGGRLWLSANLGPNDRVILLGHLVPVLLWFLLPKRLGMFLWYLSPKTDQPLEPDRGPFHGFAFYLDGFLTDYLAEPWMFGSILVLMAIALVSWRRWPPAGGFVWVFLIVATVLTAFHPMLKVRLMHSWVAVYWVVAGIGFAILLARLSTWSRPTAHALGCALLIGAAVSARGSLWDAGHAQESGVRDDRPSIVGMTDSYLSELDARQSAQIVSSIPENPGLAWTYLERFKRPRQVRVDLASYNRITRDLAAADRWFKTTSVDALLFIDIPATSPFYEGTPIVPLEPLRELARLSGRFGQTRQWDLADGTTVSLWTRTGGLDRR